MSVLIPSLSVYNYVHNAVKVAAYRSECDVWYSYSIVSHFKNKDVETESKRLVMSWLTLNERSYNVRYHKQEFTLDVIYPEFMESEFKLLYLSELHPLQVLQYLRCIRYNIELETIEEEGATVSEHDRKDHELLGAYIYDLMDAIITHLPEWEKLDYCGDKKPFKPQPIPL